jgi:parallel beta-helix repeat protein
MIVHETRPEERLEMNRSRNTHSWLVQSCLAATAALVATTPAAAFRGTLDDWQSRYGAQSSSGDTASCQLCHGNANGGSPWNAYGWDVREALADAGCDLDMDGTVSNPEAFFCVEMDDSDRNTIDNVSEIGLNAQPGWVEGPFNTLFSRSGTETGQLPPDGIGTLDPDGSEPPPEPPPPPSDDDLDLPPGQMKRDTIVVRPGQSIQAAIDRAQPGTRIYVLAGVYREFGDDTNALSISKSGIRLIGQKATDKRVVLENAGQQRNGVAVVPDDRTDCMSCHTDLRPPFPTHPGVEPGLKMREPMIQGFEIRGITIQGFTNGLFTENVDGFRVIDVESIDNSAYGIFPTLSKNGLITHSYATGSDDSGIWVETSEDVEVIHNLVEGNVNGFEVSNSDDILLARNEIRGNSVGIANLLLPDIFDDRAGAKRVNLRDNWIHHNNKDNTARPGSILSEVPKGIGILHLGVDDSVISGNRVEQNEFVGIGLVDYCLGVATSDDFNCATDPTITPEFIADSTVTNNRVERNVVLDNGANPPGGLLGTFAADLTLLALEPNGNCYQDNVYDTYTSFAGAIPDPPVCPEPELRSLLDQCGLGAELSVLLPGLLWLRRRWRGSRAV